MAHSRRDAPHAPKAGLGFHLELRQVLTRKAVEEWVPKAFLSKGKPGSA